VGYLIVGGMRERIKIELIVLQAERAKGEKAVNKAGFGL